MNPYPGYDPKIHLNDSQRQWEINTKIIDPNLVRNNIKKIAKVVEK